MFGQVVASLVVLVFGGMAVINLLHWIVTGMFNATKHEPLRDRIGGILLPAMAAGGIYYLFLS